LKKKLNSATATKSIAKSTVEDWNIFEILFRPIIRPYTKKAMINKSSKTVPSFGIFLAT